MASVRSVNRHNTSEQRERALSPGETTKGVRGRYSFTEDIFNLYINFFLQIRIASSQHKMVMNLSANHNVLTGFSILAYYRQGGFLRIEYLKNILLERSGM